MHCLGELWRRLRFLSRRRQFDVDLEEELQFHLDMKVAAYREAGMPADEAGSAARRRLGNTTWLAESTREAWGWGFVGRLAQDFRYACRSLRRTPGFTAAAILTLALGIGANTVMFSIVDTILLRPFPYPHPEQLVFIWTRSANCGRCRSSLPDFLDWRARHPAFQDMGAWIPTSFDLRGSAFPEEIIGKRATAGFFSTLGIQPQLGRGFLPEEERDGHDRVVLIGDRFWRTRFHADPRVVGSTLSLSRNKQPYEKYLIIGVLPASLEEAWPKYSDIWGAMAQDGEEAHQRQMGGFDVLARLQPQVSMAQAQDVLSRMESGLASSHPDKNFIKTGVSLVSLHENLTGYGRPELAGLMGAVGFVLLIACVNVANLMLARAVERRRELAIRAAIGAGRARLFRQLLTESVTLALGGGVAGALLSVWGVRLARTLLPAGIHRAGLVTVDARVLLFTAAVSALAGVIFGLLPALRASRANLSPSLQSGRESAARDRSRLRQALVVAEIALGLMLLAGAGLMLNSFIRLVRVDPGFDRHNLLVVQTHLPEKYRDKRPEERWADIRRILAQVKSVPGVRYAAVSDFRPLGSTMFTVFRKEAGGRALAANRETVGGDYFEAMGTPLVRGRLFGAQDSTTAPGVAVINEAAARRYWPEQDPVGKRFIVVQGRKERATSVIGVVADVRRMNLNKPADPAFYIPQAQDPSTLLDLVIRTQPGIPPMDVAAGVRMEIAAFDFALAASEVTTMQAVVDERLSQPRFLTTLLGLFGALALLLTATGIYGLMAYSVRARTHEIGIRMALGADRRKVLGMILGCGAKLIAMGLVLGVAAALAATRLLARMLYGVKPGDPLTIAGVVCVLILAALAANYIPARRATQVDPLVALRHE